MKKSSAVKKHTAVSLVLLVIGLLFMAQGVSKPVLWFLGARSPGYISYQENSVSSRGALWVRYKFTTADGLTHSGTAMTASKNSRFLSMQVAYLPFFPDLNMPAYGGYAALLGSVWFFSGMLVGGISRLFMRKTG
jgi:hypothetical protein